MKRILSATLALALGLSLGGSALAASGGYAGSITVNGTALDTASLPAAPAGAVYLPLRAVAEADYGFADWYADENRSYFALDGNRVYVDCATGAIEVNGETVRHLTTWPVLNGIDKPVAAIVLGHISNKTDDQNLNDADFMARGAQGIVDGIIAYFQNN